MTNIFVWASDNIKVSNCTKLYDDRCTSIKQKLTPFFRLWKEHFLLNVFLISSLNTFHHSNAFENSSYIRPKMIFDVVYLKTIYCPQITK